MYLASVSSLLLFSTSVASFTDSIITPTSIPKHSFHYFASFIHTSTTMAEAARLYGLLQASTERNAYHNKALAHDLSPYVSSRKQARTAAHRSVSCSLLEALTQPQLDKPISAKAKVGLKHILDLLDASIAYDDANAQSQEIIPLPSPAMAGRLPVLSTTSLPQATPEEQSATASPARGTAMLNSIFKSVRVPEFRHKWMFWAEKGQQAPAKDKPAPSEEYASRPKPLGDQIISVKEFYQHFNNIPVESLKLRDSIHLFHLGVKPVWEDPRNTRGGAWYFKIPKDQAAQFWHEMCLLAVGDGLQGAVETKRACECIPSPLHCPSLTSTSLQR
jgi:hypothetical protein